MSMEMSNWRLSNDAAVDNDVAWPDFVGNEDVVELAILAEELETWPVVADRVNTLDVSPGFSITVV